MPRFSTGTAGQVEFLIKILIDVLKKNPDNREGPVAEAI